MILLIGGVIALGASYGIVRLLSGFDIPVLLTPDVVVMACCCAIGVGVVFRSVPAWKASKLRPIDALRFE
ncbi:MAG: hypothetical protein NZL83_03410 [Candidatus Absconditabacterales bacterium]|nr:hypothetical protein [Candidatus Absconditabacterales bacterium]